MIAVESLEPRALLAVTATLSGSDLQISLGAADDVAYLSNDGTNYIVRGTGLSGYTASLATVNSVAVAGTAAANQSFTVVAGVGAVVTDPLTVAASVESTTVNGAINTIGSVTIGSASTTLAGDVTTTGKQEYKGDVGLVGDRALSAGAGDIAFGGKVDSSPQLFADPDAFATGTALTNAFPGITLSAVGTNDTGAIVTAVSKNTFAPTGSRVFAGKNGDGSWDSPGNVLKAAFASPVSSTSVDVGLSSFSQGTSYLKAYDAGGTLVAAATHTASITTLASATWTFYTDDDDKDENNTLALTLYDKNGQVVASESGLGRGVWNDYSTHTLSLTIPPGTISKERLIGGTVGTVMSGDDGEWRFHGTVELVYSDGTTSTETIPYSQWDGYGSDTETIVADQPYTPPPPFSSITLSVSAPEIAYVLTSFDPVGESTAVLDNLQATYATTPAASLTVNSAGATKFGGVVGGKSALASLTTDAGGTTVLSGGGVTTKADVGQVYGDDVTLEADTSLTAKDGGIDFKKTLDGGYTLTIDTGKNVAFGGSVGNTGALAGIALKAATSVTAADTIKLDGTTPRVGGTATPFADGLTIYGGVNKVSLIKQGSEVKNFTGNGVVFLGGSTQSTISGVTIAANSKNGVVVNKGDYTGTVIRANTISSNGAEGISLVAAGDKITNLRIGGDKTAATSEGNAIYSNKSDGIQADAGDYTGTVIQGNQIGSSAFAFTMTAGGTQVTIAGDQTRTFTTGQAVALQASAPAAGPWLLKRIQSVDVVAGNTVITFSGAIDDTTTAGTLVAGNRENGIFLNAASGTLSSLTIGGGDEKFGNEIYASAGDGIRVESGVYTNTVIGPHNDISLNYGSGIALQSGGAKSLTITGNVIGKAVGGGVGRDNDNFYGIVVATGDFKGTAITANKIRYSDQTGVILRASGASITGLALTDNTISTNDADGIIAEQGDYTGTVIQGNTVSSNTNNGISLIAAGGTLSNLTIGGDAAKVGNDISSNKKHGISADAGTYTSLLIGSNSIHDNTGNGVQLTAAVGASSVSNNLIDGNGVNGILATDSVGVTINGNEITSNKGNGVSVKGGSGGIGGNTIESNGADGVALYGGYNVTDNAKIRLNSLHGIQVGTGLEGLKITGNPKIDENTGDGIHFDGGFKAFDVSTNGIKANKGSGMLLQPGTVYTGSAIKANTVASNLQYGIRLDTVSPTSDADAILIAKNAVTGNTNSGISLRSSARHLIIGNTASGNGQNGVEVTTLSESVRLASNVVKNNTSNGFAVSDSTSVHVGDEIAFTTTAGGTTLTIAGDKTAVILPGIMVSLVPPPGDPPLGVLRTVVAVSLVGGNTEVTVDAAMNATDTTGMLSGSNQAMENGGDGIQATSSELTSIVANYADGNSGNGIRVGGGSGEMVGNVVSGNGSNGIVLGGAYDVSSNNVFSNDLDGVSVSGGLASQDIDHNWIYDNGGSGIHFAGGVTSFSIYRNDIGQAPDNTAAGNAAYGVRFDAGTYTGTRLFDNEETTGVEGGSIAYNLLDGIFLNAGGQAITGVTIGGSNDDGNSIHDNHGSGIAISKGDYTGTVIQGNTISGNTASGMLLSASTGSLTNLTIGGGAPPQGNRITANTGDGILVVGGTYTGTTILRNWIDANGADGMHLGMEGIVSLGRIVVRADGLSGNPLSGANAASLYTSNNPASLSIQAIAAAGYPGVQPSLNSLGITVMGTPPTTLAGPGGIGGIDDPGVAYRDAVQAAFASPGYSKNPAAAYGSATFDKLTSGTLPNGGVQDAFLFYDSLFGGADVLGLSIEGNLVSANASDGIEAVAGDHAGTVIASNTIRDNGDMVAHVGNGILVNGKNLMIGGTADPAQPNTVANTITGNALNGVEISGAGAQQNHILSNSIYLNGTVVGRAVTGKGIVLTNGGNNDQPAPRILSAVNNTTTQMVTVRIVVPVAGSYLVQLFDNTQADAQGLVPAQPGAFEGRTLVGQAVVEGNESVPVSIPASRLPSGTWVTATATLLASGTTPTATSEFSTGVKVANAATAFAVGAESSHGRAILALPGARLYDVSTGELILDAPLASVYGAAFNNSFRGGIRVTTADVDSDGYTDLITAPGSLPAWMTPGEVASARQTFGTSLQTIGIFSGNPYGTWQTASFSTAAFFGGGYAGGFQVTAADVLGNGSPQIVVTNAGGATAAAKVGVFQNSALALQQPLISVTPIQTGTAAAGRVTGLAAGAFDGPNTKAGIAVATVNRGVTTVSVLRDNGGPALVNQRQFRATAFATPGGKVQRTNIFSQGATLSAGDVDADGASDLLLGPAAMGWGTFRVLAGGLMSSGTQSAVDTALAGGGAFGAPAAFTWATNAYSANGRLNLVAVDSGGDGKFDVYAAAGSSNMTSATLVTGPNKGKGDLVRRLAFASLSGWSAKPNTFTANSVTVNGRGTRFTVANGLQLG